MPRYAVSWSDMPTADGPGESYKFEWDLDELGLKEAREIKKQTGLNPPQWLSAVTQDDPESFTALALLLLRRDGQDIRWDDVELNWGSVKFEPLDPVDPPQADGDQ